ncbi:fluoride efflux transporter CrcB [Geobacter sp. DSM 9736]|uniref:fluoride efflux transporter CrcB n=1 Tax=Geobacter sp. DSM 9736 TaxID=1277350 RepID=UPI000B4FE208|nr:fluoride efflux transporter CrcB [Geobacter sp. DSM 9736]SNB47935.1 camphor resistance protein CrcB [Geobacter sp. DSM 9736]
MAVAVSIALLGALGCLARFYFSGWVYGVAGRTFPYGTLAVNLVGAFCIGFIMESSTRSDILPPMLRTGLAVGFLGGLTTFSTFSYETFRLLEDGEFWRAATNVLVSVLACLLFTWLGITAAKAL